MSIYEFRLHSIIHTALTTNMGQEENSPQYNRLSEDQKNIADAIISFLNGINTKSAERILNALLEEITYNSEIRIFAAISVLSYFTLQFPNLFHQVNQFFF